MNKTHPPTYPAHKPRRDMHPGLELALNIVIITSFFAATWLFLVAAGGN